MGLKFKHLFKKILAVSFLILFCLLGLNIAVLVVIAFNLRGSALFGGQKNVNGIYMVHSHGKYHPVSEKTFLLFLLYEIISWSLPVILVVLYFTFRFIFRKSFKEVEAGITDINKSMDHISFFKKIDSERAGLYCSILVIICAVIYLWAAYYCTFYIDENVRPVINLEDKSNKDKNADYADLFPPLEESENINYPSKNHQDKH